MLLPEINKINGSFTNLMGLPAYSEAYIESGISGHYRLCDSSGVYDGAGMDLHIGAAEAGQEDFVYENSISKLDMRLVYLPDCDVCKVMSTIINKTKAKSTIYSARLRFTFSGSNYHVYTQSSGWCAENQGAWQPLVSGITVSCQGLRSCEGGTPCLALRNKNTGEGIAFHLLPRGRWRIDVCKKTCHSGKVYTVVELGLDDTAMQLELSPEENLPLPDIIFHTIDSTSLCEHKIQSYALNHAFQLREVPFVYNSWFYDFDRIDLNNFLNQASTAAELGCEAFVVDAGWFGKGTDWSGNVGDWSENRTGAFFGKMKDFSDKIRSMGMVFGLWMEPERAAPTSKIAIEHPEYFIPADNGCLVLNIAREDARKFILNETSRLIETYNVGMMKVDFNTGISLDPNGSAFYRYYQGLSDYMNTLKRKYPHVIFEGCSSGGMRTDIQTMSLFDGHFLTDTVNPVEDLRILQGALMRLPVASLSKWAVFRSASATWRPYYENVPKKNLAVICGDGLWEKLLELDPTFVMSTLIGGACGLGGDLSSLNDETKAVLSLYIQRAKEERKFFLECVTYSLCVPSTDILDTHTPVIWQHYNIRTGRSIVIGYRFEGEQNYAIRPKSLIPEKRYKVCDYLSGKILFSDIGNQLILDFQWKSDYQCIAYIIEEM